MSFEMQCFSELMEDPELIAGTRRMFGNPEGEDPAWMDRFIFLTRLCVPVLPEDTIPGTTCMTLSGACVFWSPEGCEDGVIHPWYFQVCLGASAWFTFAPIGLESVQTLSAGDDEPFSEQLLEVRRDRVWVLLRRPEDVEVQA